LHSSSRRLVPYFAVLIALAIGAVVFCIDAGKGREAEPAIAGTYTSAKAADTCLGPTFDLTQSGTYAKVESEPAGSSNLRIEDGRLHGDLTCVNGGARALDAQVAGGDVKGVLGGAPFTATFAKDGPDPGAPKPLIPDSVEGDYKLAPASACLGEKIEIEEHGGGKLELLAFGSPSKQQAGPHGEMAYADGMLTGEVACKGGKGAVTVEGAAKARTIGLTITPAGPAAAPQADGAAAAPAAEKATATKQREFGHLLGAFFLALGVVMLFARLMGAFVARLGQPRVMGEVTAGILLGPTALGVISPELQDALFPSDVIPFIGVAANLGLIFYMFLIGLELDLSQLKGRLAQTVAISNTGVLLPMTVGLVVAVPVYEAVGPDTEFAGFALFMGVSLSITAFPVLARILAERRMLKGPVGVLALASAAIDDVTAWFLIALASAVAVAGSLSGVLETMGLAVIFCLVMAFAVRPVLARAATAFEEAGRVPTGWITAIFAGVLAAAYTTETIGIALIFGAFIMGAAMPRHHGLTEDVTRRVEDFVVTLLLPLFFAYTGLRTDVTQLDRPDLVVLTGLLLLVAVICKFGGTVLAARVTGLGWRESAVLGTLMNTRGLTELIVLNLALEKGVISSALFAALVVMALVTTFMAGPVLKLLDPENKYGEQVEEAFASEAVSSEPEGVARPERSIIVAPQQGASIEPLIALAVPLARSEPPRELIVARLLPPPAGAAVRGGLQTETARLAASSLELGRVRQDLAGQGVVSRTATFVSTDPGADLVRLSEREQVDLLLLDGRRPIIGRGVPKGDAGAILSGAPCDVAVLVARDGEVPSPGPDRPVMVPFGGAEHDWAALELAAWVSSATNAPLRLLGVAGSTEESAGPTRSLASASLVLQRLVGVAAEPLLAEPGQGVIDAAAGAALVIVGLSDRWQEEGLGELRAQLADARPAPILFVRRGERAGALAGRDDVTRFTWSTAMMGPR